MTHAEILPISGSQALIFLIATALMSAALIVLLKPLLLRYALARPNIRSSHSTPTPQGAGIAVIATTIVVMFGVAFLLHDPIGSPLELAIVLACAAGLAMVGATDDIRPLEVWPRLFLQSLAVVIVLALLPSSLRIIDALPWWIERALLFVALLWFVNLVNFMDGIDWMTVAEVIPLTAGLTFFGMVGALPTEGTVLAMVLCGAIIGFAPFNRPVARLFLGDVGSLPIGLLVGWLLVLLAGRGYLAAALILPLYYLADATITLLRRLLSGEQIFQAHRGHFYQRAMDNGFSVYEIVGRVFALNIALVALAATTIVRGTVLFQLIMLCIGCILVVIVLWQFSRARR
ncbi:MAG TPA: glycosyltransferase family 4 protein [Pseudolabrys sp.]|nr:glycosyltransferase family 4 protein [Pseudolabrys sp.]